MNFKDMIKEFNRKTLEDANAWRKNYFPHLRKEEEKENIDDDYIIYIMKSDDTLNSVARKFGLDVSKLRSLNNERIYIIGDKIKLPTNLHIVAKGQGIISVLKDNNMLWDIDSEEYKLFEKANNITRKSTIFENQKLKVLDKTKLDAMNGLISEKIYFELPIFKPAENNMKDISQFIQLIETLEAKYTLMESKNTKYMITQIRKNFRNYDTESWNTYLIPLAKDVKVKHLMPEINNNQNIALLNDERHGIDIGHVFVGLDSLYNKSSISKSGVSFIENNYEGNTWIGDLASVVADIYEKFISKVDINTKVVQEIIDKNANPYDLLGDIDPFILYNFIETTYPLHDTKVSQILRHLYIGTSGRGQIVILKLRVNDFLRFFGLYWIKDYEFKSKYQKGQELSDFILFLNAEHRENFDKYTNDIMYITALILAKDKEYIQDKIYQYIDTAWWNKNSKSLSSSILYTFLLMLKRYVI